MPKRPSAATSATTSAAQPGWPSRRTAQRASASRNSACAASPSPMPMRYSFAVRRNAAASSSVNSGEVEPVVTGSPGKYAQSPKRARLRAKVRWIQASSTGNEICQPGALASASITNGTSSPRAATASGSQRGACHAVAADDGDSATACPLCGGVGGLRLMSRGV